MKIVCENCRNVCETNQTVVDGQNVLCPFCESKFSFDELINNWLLDLSLGRCGECVNMSEGQLGRIIEMLLVDSRRRLSVEEINLIASNIHRLNSELDRRRRGNELLSEEAPKSLLGKMSFVLGMGSLGHSRTDVVEASKWYVPLYDKLHSASKIIAEELRRLKESEKLCKLAELEKEAIQILRKAISDVSTLRCRHYVDAPRINLASGEYVCYVSSGVDCFYKKGSQENKQQNGYMWITNKRVIYQSGIHHQEYRISNIREFVPTWEGFGTMSISTSDRRMEKYEFAGNSWMPSLMIYLLWNPTAYEYFEDIHNAGQIIEMIKVYRLLKDLPLKVYSYGRIVFTVDCVTYEDLLHMDGGRCMAELTCGSAFDAGHRYISHSQEDCQLYVQLIDEHPDNVHHKELQLDLLTGSQRIII